MNEKRFNEIDQNIKQLAPNAPLILKLNHDALLQDLNQIHCNLQKPTVENNQKPMRIKPEPSTLTKIGESTVKGINKKRESKSDKYSKYTKIGTGNFFFWNSYSCNTAENRWVGRTMFFANNKIIASGIAKKHPSVDENSEKENLPPKRQ